MTRHDDWGVADGWWATDGAWREVDPETRSILHRVQGSGDHPDGPPSTPPLWFVRPGERHDLRTPATLELEDGTVVEAQVELPPDLPLGAHRLHPADGGPTTALFVVPERSPRPARGWGWSTQLYATTSAHSWGHGDLVDLADLAVRTRSGGGSLLAHNPLGAPLPTAHQPPSPYYPPTPRSRSGGHPVLSARQGALPRGLPGQRAGQALPHLSLCPGLIGPGRATDDERRLFGRCRHDQVRALPGP